MRESGVVLRHGLNEYPPFKLPHYNALFCPSSSLCPTFKPLPPCSHSFLACGPKRRPKH